jgi:predicted DCC family thiol-disulfide oxidoreductase YuxK
MKINQPRVWLGVTTAVLGFLWIVLERVTTSLLGWQLPAKPGLFAWLVLGLFAVFISSPTIRRRFVGEVTPATLGIIRIVACTCMLIVVLVLEDVPTTALFPEAMHSSMGIIDYLRLVPGFSAFLRNQAALQVFEWLTALCLIFGLVGWKTRIMIPLGALGGCIIGGITRQYLFSFYHQGLVPVYMLAILSLTPCGDGLSIDRLIKIYRGQPVPDANRPLPIYAWSRYACWVFLVLAYMASGTSKLKNHGFEWLDPINLRGMMYGCTLQHCNNYDFDLSLRLGPHLPDIVYVIFGVVGTFGEIAFITVLFSALARWIMPILMISLHIGILFFQNIIFIEFVVLQLMFVNYTKVRQAIAQRVQLKHGKVQVFYDGKSSVACRSVRLLNSFDLFNRLEFVNIRELDFEQYNQIHGQNLTLSQLETVACVLVEGKLYSGASAYLKLARVIPVLWLTIPFLSWSVLSPVGKWLHRHILLRYFQLSTSSYSYPSQFREFAEINLPTPTRNTGHYRYPLLIMILSFVLSMCWYFPFYFYPLTGLHLFAYKDTSGVVLYNKIYATNVAGETFRIYPEDIIRAQSVASSRRVTNQCFSSDANETYVCNEYLKALGSVHNKTSTPNQRFKQLEVQRWRWPFLEDPFDRNFGQVVERHSLTVDLSSSQAQSVQ